MDEREARLVRPFYLEVHGGNLTRLVGHEQETLRDAMRGVAADASLEVATHLWSVQDWRSNLMASWWATVWRWPESTGEVERLLIPSATVFAGQIHCLVLACQATQDAGAVLARYLDDYLAQLDKFYDQSWAMSALSIVDESLGQHLAADRLELYRRWVADKPHYPGPLDLVPTIRRMLTFAGTIADTPFR